VDLSKALLPFSGLLAKGHAPLTALGQKTKFALSKRFWF
jgi:hypothetical protein